MHHLNIVLNSLEDSFLHDAEAQLRKENLLMTLKETSRDPLINGHADLLTKCKHSALFLFEYFGLLNGLEEESGERLK